MGYIQGTAVRVVADLADPETGDPFVPEDLVVTVEPPGAPAFEATLSEGAVHVDPRTPGRYFYVLDTSLAAGVWRYQVEAVGADAVVARKSITVGSRLPRVAQPL